MPDRAEEVRLEDEDMDVDTVKQSATKRKGRGFETNNNESRTQVTKYDKLPTSSATGAVQKSVEGYIVLVTNVHEEATEEDLKDLLAEYGQIRNLHLNLDRRTGYVKGYCLVEYEKLEEAKKAIEDLQGKEFLSLKLAADFCFVKGATEGEKKSDRRK